MRTSYQYLILLSSALIRFILLSDFMTICSSAPAFSSPEVREEKVEARVACDVHRLWVNQTVPEEEASAEKDCFSRVMNLLLAFTAYILSCQATYLIWGY